MDQNRRPRTGRSFRFPGELKKKKGQPDGSKQAEGVVRHRHSPTKKEIEIKK